MSKITLLFQKSKKTVLMRAMLVGMLCSPFSAQASVADLSKSYSNCMDNSGGVTQEMVECITNEYQQQDARLNAAYKALRVTLNAERKKHLTNAQRAWISFRDANCHFYLDPDGGSLARVNANHCMMTMTAQRASELESLNR